MNNRIQYFIALVSLLYIFTSCRKDMHQEEPRDEMTKIKIDLSIDMDDDLRLAQKVDDAGVPHTFISGDRLVKLRLGFKTINDSDDVYIVDSEELLGYDLDKEFLQKVRGGYRYSEEIPFPRNMLGKKIIMVASVVGAKDNEFFIDRNKKWNEIEEPKTLILPNKNAVLDIPAQIYYSDPIEFVLTEQKYNPLKVTIKPRGTLLRFNLYNDTSAPVSVKGIKISSNAISPRYGTSVYSILSSPRNVFSRERRDVVFDRLLEIPNKEIITVAPRERMFAYLLVPPVLSSDNFSSRNLIRTLIRAVGPNDEVYAPFYSEKPLKEGWVDINLSLKPQTELAFNDAFPSGHHLLEYMAEYNMKDKTTLATSLVEEINNSLAGLGYLRFADLGDDRRKRVAIDTPDADERGYYVPDTRDWDRVLLPFLENRYVEASVVEDYGLVPNEFRKSQLAVVRGIRDRRNAFSGVSTLYALRFWGNAHRQLTAFRYYFDDEVVGTKSYKVFRISSRYLGPKFLGNINTISTPEFWDTNNSHDIVRTIPIELGYWNATNKVVQDRSIRTPYMTSGYQTVQVFPMVHNFSQVVPSDAWRHGYSVRLFMRNPPAR